MLKTVSTGIGSNGTVTSINTGTGLTGGPITGNGTISIANTTVTAGTYGNASTVAQVVINAQGQITSASNVAINISGQLTYAGTWNASTNTPTLTSSVGTLNNYYVVNVAGTTTLNGISTWNVGDWAIFNGTVWERVDGGAYGTVSQVQGNGTVNGITLTGNVTSTGNLTLGGTLGNVANSQLSNSSITLGNTSVSLGSTASSIGNLTLANVTIISGTVPSANTSNIATNLAGGIAYQIPYQSAANTTGFINNGTNGQVLVSIGTIAAPAFSSSINITTVTATNISTGNVSITGGTINVQSTNLTASTAGNATYATSSLLLVPAGFFEIDLNGTVVKVPYYSV